MKIDTGPGKLPPEIVDEYRAKFETVTFFGLSLTELNREELMAAICIVARYEDTLAKAQATGGAFRPRWLHKLPEMIR